MDKYVWDNKFYVWKRNDGHVNCTKGHMPINYFPGNNSLKEITFEKLGEFEEWEDALKLITEKRNETD